jgi:hypothetical protein
MLPTARKIREAFKNKHSNPIYRQKALEKVKTEETAKERRNVKEAQQRTGVPSRRRLGRLASNALCPVAILLELSSLL